MDFARQVSHTQRGVSHTLQRTDVLIKTFELQIFRVGIAGPPKVPHLRAGGTRAAVAPGSVRDVRILMVSRNEPLLPLGGPLRNYILQLRRMLDTAWVAQAEE